jgi:hypothetical protein
VRWCIDIRLERRDMPNTSDTPFVKPGPAADLKALGDRLVGTWTVSGEVPEPADFARALSVDPIARSAYDRLPEGLKREHVRAIESAKKPETRRRRIEKALATLRDLGSTASAAGSGRTSR